MHNEKNKITKEISGNLDKYWENCNLVVLIVKFLSLKVTE